MTYTPRAIVPHVVHHVTQRGNRREGIFFSPADYGYFLALAFRAAERFGVRIVAYCLMPNHIHLLLIPLDELGLPRMMHSLARGYARYINEKRGWTGHLWESPYHSAPMGERHTYNAIRYVLLNPVRAGLAATMLEWPYSSARIHAGVVRSDSLSRDLDKYVSDWSEFFQVDIELDDPAFDEIRLIEGRRAVVTG